MDVLKPAALMLPLLLPGCGVLGITCSNGYLEECDGYPIEEAYWDVRTRVPGAWTPVGNMPTANEADYDGYAQVIPRYGVVQGERMHARVHLDANFDESAVSGKMDQFYTLYRAVYGTVTIENGVISGNTFAADLSGEINGGGFISGSPGMATVDGTMSGRFHGNAAQGIVANVDADLTYADTVYGFLDGNAYLLETPAP